MRQDINHFQIIRLEHKLRPEQVEVIRLIQTPLLELEHAIFQQLEQNPVLEFVPEDEIPQISDEIEEEEVKLEDLKFNKELIDFLSEDLPKFFAPSRDKEEKFNERFVYAPSLKEYLKSELRFTVSDEKEIEMGEFLIDSINERGFLEIDLADAARALSVNKEEIEKVLGIIQGFDPPGIGSRDTRECLLIQFKRMGKEESPEATIIRDFFEEFKKLQLETIATKLGLEYNKVKKMVSNIKKLNLYPTKSLWGDVSYVIPDVIVEENKDNKFRIIINESNIPFIKINFKYLDVLKHPENYDKKTINFIKEKAKSAFLFLRTLEMRRRTFKKIIEYIIDYQKEFLKKGVLYKKPLKLKEIASKVGVHESTVSRILKGVYIQTPRGVFDAKQLFSGGVGTINGKISREVIKEKIKIIIANEKKTDPFNDREIAEMLSKEGINIGVRTVAKYREELGIPPGRIRKKESF